MIRLVALYAPFAAVLTLGLSVPGPVLAQDNVESLYDTAPGLEPPRDRRRENDNDDFDDDEPGLEDLLNRMDRGRGSAPDRGGRDPLPPEDYDVEEEDRDLPPRRDRDLDEPEDPTFKRTERDGRDFKRAKPDLGHKVIAGLWSGTVEEVGQDPYTLRLSLKGDGSGTAAYSRLDCASEIVPIAGKLLEYREKITMGHEKCSDGVVQLRLRRGLLLWSWKDENGEVRAAATLRRDAGEGDRPEKSIKKSESEAAKRSAIAGDGVVVSPADGQEQVGD